MTTNEELRMIEDAALKVTRVLVVDDDPHINRLLQVRLKTRGYEIGSASNGQEALDLLESFQPDLMFVDVSMPGIGGLEVLGQVRATKRDTAIIMMTAFGSEEVAIEALRNGADDYLRKPFEPTEFKTVLDRTVARLELSRQNAALRLQLDEKRRQLEAELARAAAVQAALIPTIYPDLSRFDLAACCLPARRVGGDFYDWQQPGNGTLTLTLGDVMGKGMPAALLMATVRATLRASCHANSPAAAVGLAGVALEDDLERSGSFMTLFHGRLDLESKRMTYVDAGHGHVLLLRSNGAVDELLPRGLPFGVSFDVPYEEGTLQFEPGDALIIYSDGLVDARPDLHLDRFAVAATVEGATAAQDMVNCLAELAVQPEALPDDLTIVVLRCRDG